MEVDADGRAAVEQAQQLYDRAAADMAEAREVLAERAWRQYEEATADQVRAQAAEADAARRRAEALLALHTVCRLSYRDLGERLGKSPARIGQIINSLGRTPQKRTQRKRSE